VSEPAHEHGTIHSGVGFSAPKVVPHAEDLERAAAVLNEGQRVAMLVGAGALGARDEVSAVAELLGAGVAKALLGKAVLPDDLPFVTGSIGLLGTEPTWNLMQECDTLLMVGSGFPYAEFLPKEGRARGVQIDIDPRMLGIRYPMEVNLVGDAKETLRALMPLLHSKLDRSWADRIRADVVEWWKLLEELAMQDANPINPQRVFHELSKEMPANAITTCDAGTSAIWWARHVKVKGTMLTSLSGNLASMGSGVPYAIAAKFCWPSRPAVACVGDGAMQMNGLNGLLTVAKYWQEWSDPRLVVCVLVNRDLNLVTWEQRVMEGDPEFTDAQEIPDFQYAEYARSIGLDGVRVDDPDALSAAFKHALSADRPCVLDVRTDSDVAPFPPHITLEQTRAFMTSMLKGDPHWKGVLKQSAKQMAAKVLPDFMKT
jgi:pyruvate dehydrogenase (quinone)